jgi:hypothetical protein
MAKQVSTSSEFDQMMMSILFGDAKPADFNVTDDTLASQPIGADTLSALIDGDPWRASNV